MWAKNAHKSLLYILYLGYFAINVCRQCLYCTAFASKKNKKGWPKVFIRQGYSVIDSLLWGGESSASVEGRDVIAQPKHGKSSATAAWGKRMNCSYPLYLFLLYILLTHGDHPYPVSCSNSQYTVYNRALTPLVPFDLTSNDDCKHQAVRITLKAFIFWFWRNRNSYWRSLISPSGY
jgi:hypothetical protein